MSLPAPRFTLANADRLGSYGVRDAYTGIVHGSSTSSVDIQALAHHLNMLHDPMYATSGQGESTAWLVRACGAPSQADLRRWIRAYRLPESFLRSPP